MFNLLYEDLVVATANLHEELSEKSVHDARVAIRSTKSLLITFNSILQKEPISSLLTELSWLNKRLAGLRDLDVMKETMATYNEESFGSEIMKLLSEQRAEIELVVIEELASNNLRSLINSYFEFSSTVPIKKRVLASSTEEQQASIQLLLVQMWVKLFNSLAKLPLNPTPNELHSIRIATKRCRYAFEAAKAAKLFTAENQIIWAKKLQQVLGQAQDNQTLRNWIKEQEELPRELRSAALLQVGRAKISSSQLLSIA